MLVFSRSQQLLFLTIAFFAIIGHDFFTISPSQAHLSANNPTLPHDQWIVEVIGAVPRPGIYLFDRKPTIGQAIDKAGRNDNIGDDPSGDHKSRLLQTGAMIRVLSRTSESLTSIKTANAFIAGLPMDVNTASGSDLSLVPGIAKSLAYRIVTFREINGHFRSWKDLQQVKGIGSTTVARIRKYIHY